VADPTVRETPGSNGIFLTFRAVDSLPKVPGVKVLCCAVIAQGIAVVVLRDRPMAFGAVLGIGVALLVLANRVSAWSRRFGLSQRRAWAAIILTIAVGLAVLRLFFGGGDGLGGPASASARKNQDAAPGSNGDYKGVILITKPAPRKEITLPKLGPSHERAAAKEPEPMVIPFTGVYWLYKWPQSGPPAGSYVTSKSPLAGAYRTSDHYPLIMEAHQNFGRLMDLGCCSRVQVAVRSTDSYAALDLMVTNTTLPGKPSLSLGRATIGSQFDLARDNAAPESVVLDFDVPSQPAVRKFDEVTIVFNRPFARASAKVEIERFVFVPRGL
jgi:hypothetical protein